MYFDKQAQKELDMIGKGVLAALGIGGIWGLSLAIRRPEWLPASVHETMSNILQTAAIAGQTTAGVAAVTAGGYAAAQYHYRKRAAEEVQYLRILPHAHTRTMEEQVMEMVRGYHQSRRPYKERLKRGREWFQWLFVCNDNGDIEMYCGYPKDRGRYIPNLLKNCYPNSERVPIPTDHVPIPGEKGEGGTLYWANRQMSGLPLKPFQGKEKSPSLLSVLEPGTTLAVTFSPTTPTRLKKSTKRTRNELLGTTGFGKKEEIDEKDLDPKTQEKLEQMKAREKGNPFPFDVQVHVWQNDADRAVIESVVNQLNNALKRSHNELYLKKSRKNPIELAPYPYRQAMTWTAVELANLLHLPSGKTEREREEDIPHIMDRIPHLIAGQNWLDEEEFTEGVPIGALLHPAEEKRMVRLIEKKLRKMGLVLGQIGSGKTALILTMIRLYLLQRGYYAYADPKGDGAKTLLSYYRAEKEKNPDFDDSRVHYFELASPEFSIGLNLLEILPGQTERDVVNNAIQVLQNAYRTDSDWLRKYARPTIKALLRDDETHSILAIPEFLREDSPLRKRIMNKLEQGTTDDRELYRTLKDYEDKKQLWGNQVEPLLNRLGELRDNPITKRIFGQRKTTLNVQEWLEKGDVLLLNTEGLTKEENRLVTGYIMTLFHQAAQQRNNKQTNYYVFVDEAHELQLPIMYQQIIPKDRQKGLVLFLLTQFLEQFETELKDAITEIGGNIFTFISGKKTANEVQEMTGFKAEDIQSLSELTAAVYTENSQGERVKFMIRTEPPYILKKDGTPTYHGTDEDRMNREETEAFREAQALGREWMKRDCLTAEQAQKEIDRYLESMWSIDQPRAEDKNTDSAGDTTKPSATVNKYADRMKKYKKR